MVGDPMLNSPKFDFKKMYLPILLFSVLLFPLFFGSFISLPIKSFLYALSLSMKSVLLLLLPFIIFSFLFSSLLNLKSGVIKFILALIAMVFISNCIAIFTGFSIGSSLLPKLSIPIQNPTNLDLMLKPLWTLNLPKLIPNEAALLTGFILGLFFSYKKNTFAQRVAKTLNSGANLFLNKIFVPLLPVFILGFAFKLEQDQILGSALKIYGPVFFIVVGTQISYMLLLYLITANFSLKRFLIYLKNVFPATITGFSTVSSAATMPILILCTEKNLSKPECAKIILPVTINIHTLGSALGLTILSLTTLLAFGHKIPEMSEFLQFGFYYALAKFAVAAVPGGVIIVATPLLETYLNFSSEMIGLITAIYMLFDPFGTAANVTGNGFFAIAFSKLFNIQLGDAKSEESSIAASENTLVV